MPVIYVCTFRFLCLEFSRAKFFVMYSWTWANAGVVRGPTKKGFSVFLTFNPNKFAWVPTIKKEKVKRFVIPCRAHYKALNYGLRLRNSKHEIEGKFKGNAWKKHKPLTVFFSSRDHDIMELLNANRNLLNYVFAFSGNFVGKIVLYSSCVTAFLFSCHICSHHTMIP